VKINKINVPVPVPSPVQQTHQIAVQKCIMQRCITDKIKQSKQTSGGGLFTSSTLCLVGE